MDYVYSIEVTNTYHCLGNSTSIFTAELIVIHTCLPRLTPNTYCYLSLSSLLHLSYPRKGPIQSILTRHTTIYYHVNDSFLLLNTGPYLSPSADWVDFAAKASLLFYKISNPVLIPAYDLKDHYRTIIFESGFNYRSLNFLTNSE